MARLRASWHLSLSAAPTSGNPARLPHPETVSLVHISGFLQIEPPPRGSQPIPNTQDVPGWTLTFLSPIPLPTACILVESLQKITLSCMGGLRRGCDGDACRQEARLGSEPLGPSGPARPPSGMHYRRPRQAALYRPESARARAHARGQLGAACLA